MSGTVHIVHAIDTEGPLYESIEAKFERLTELFGLERIEPSRANLERLGRGEIDLGEKTQRIKEVLKSHKANTLGSWDQIEEMLGRVCSPAFRNQYPDSDGQGWVFNWFCMDHVGYETNPRKRDMGFLNIHDYYAELIRGQPWSRDTLEFHFHPMSTYREAHRCATHYLRSDELYQSLCRRVIERKFFPASYRAGFQAERPDSHWFLEQFIPYDISNMATEDTRDIDNSIDFRNGRSGNWRKAPSDWSVYHPSHDDYQVPGHCRRLIGRALNLRSRIGGMTQVEMDKAFARAEAGQDTVVGLCSHDWRDLGPEVESALEMLKLSKQRHPSVAFKYSGTVEAFRTQLAQDRKAQRPLRLSIRFHPEKPGEDVPFIEIKAEQGEVFGPQPFLAIKTKANRYLHDNLDFAVAPGTWYYAFHGDTLPLSDIAEIGVAANDILGNTRVVSFVPGEAGGC
ncbi:MAG: hypothetical protein IPN00_04930 [Hydrogenophilales bacterium]|nr:hypothetical protein [Hydrogenophilales bacterium]